MAGELLKKRREELGLSVKEAAETLKIRADYLSAIESDAFEKLPVPVYTVGYIRSYAKYLDIDSEPIVLFYSEHLAQPKTAAIMPVAFSRRKSPLVYTVIAIVSVFIVLCVLFAVYYLPQNLPQKEVGGKSVSVPAVELSKQNARTGDGPLQQQPPAAESRREAPQAKEHVLYISAEETTWLSIKFSDGKKEETLLRPGESRSWKFDRKALLTVGNAGGVKIKFDGEDLGTPGATGEVVNMTLPEEKESGSIYP